MMRYAVIFSGQGMQHAAMLPWLPDSPLTRALEARLGRDDWRTALADPDWAQANRHAQMLLAAVQTTAWQVLAAGLPPPAAVAGYSVGELAAGAAAGAYDAETALALADCRARLMDACAQDRPGGLLAVGGLAEARLAALCEQSCTQAAIVNGPDAWICGGPDASLALLQDLAQAAGARCTRLKVAVPSHTRWMHAAARAFAEALEEIEMQAPRACRFVSNTGQAATTAAELRHALAWQIDHTVQWQACMDELHDSQPRCVLEIGPGQALARLWNARHPDIPARSIDEFHSAASAIGWVLRHAEY